MAKGRSQADMMTVGRALARENSLPHVGVQNTHAKCGRFSQGPPCHHVCLTPTVLAARQYNSLNHNVGCRWLRTLVNNLYNDATKYVNASISALPPGEMFMSINS